MALWGTKLTSTSKMSLMARRIARDRAQHRLDDLCRLRDRAIQCSDVLEAAVSDTTVSLHPQEEQDSVDLAPYPPAASVQNNSLFVPRSEDFAVQLESRLDVADFQDATPSCRIDSWLQTAGSSTDRAFLSALEMSWNEIMGISHSCRVSAEDLQQLQKCIDETKHLRDALHRSMEEVYGIKRKRSDKRHDMLVGKRSDTNAVMLSRGLGSPLREVISVDEEWREPEGEWGMPPPRRQRKMIYRGERSRLRLSNSAGSCGKSSE